MPSRWARQRVRFRRYENHLELLDDRGVVDTISLNMAVANVSSGMSTTRRMSWPNNVKPLQTHYKPSLRVLLQRQRLVMHHASLILMPCFFSSLANASIGCGIYLRCSAQRNLPFFLVSLPQEFCEFDPACSSSFILSSKFLTWSVLPLF